MAQTLTVLITGVGSPGAPGVIQSLRTVKDMNFHIIGIDMQPLVAGAGLADQFIQVPKASDPDFIEKLLSICSGCKVDVVLPLVSGELPVFAQHLTPFHSIGTEVSVSEYPSLVKAMNKGRLLKFLEAEDFIVPDYKIVQTADDLLKAIHDLGYPERPVCFKPAISDGSRGFHVLDAGINRFEFLFNEKPNSAYLSERELIDVLRNYKSIPETVVTEFLPGEEYSVDILADHGHVLAALPRLRQKMVDGISVQSKIVKAEDVIHYTKTIVEALKLHGNIGVQVRRDRSGKAKILEINPRIQGTIVHCTAAGINLPYLAIKLAKGLPITAEDLSVKWGSQMIRYWNEVYFSEEGQFFLF